MPPRGTSAVKMSARLTGPFWTNHGQFKRASEEAVELTAGQAEGEIKQYLGRVIKHPTGAYEGAIHTVRQTNSTKVVDGGQTYGPWLESGRTRGPGGAFRTTRFKGYAAFRRTRVKVARWLRRHAQEKVSQTVKALGGK